MRTLLLAIAMVTFPGGPLHAQSEPELAVIVNRSVSDTAISSSELEMILTSKQRHFSDGQSIVAFSLPEENPVQVAVYQVVLRMKPDEVGRYWVDQRIRGGAGPPRQVSDEALMARLVARLPGAVGVVSRSAVKGDVRVVGRISKGQVLPP
jgi:hypothetical protein